MKIRNAVSALIACLILFTHPSVVRADSFTFATIPATGIVSGPAGATVGWGYSITNGSLTDWLVTAGLNADGFVNGTPGAIFDFPILAPGATVTVAFDAGAGLGLYQLTWDVAAPVGFTNVGNFLLSAEWWDADPFAGGNFLTSAPDQLSPYSASVTGASSTPVPEPSTLLLLACGLGMLALLKKEHFIRERSR